MNSNVSNNLIAGILIALGVFIGTQYQNIKTADQESVFFDSEQENHLAQQTSINEFNIKTLTKKLKLAQNLSADLTDSLSRFLPYQVPKPKEILPQKLPVPENIPAPELKIKAGVSIDQNGYVFYEKNSQQQLPIASLTKLLTALVVLDNLDLNDIITISNNAVSTYGEMGDLKANEKISVENLLYVMLMDSSNDAAVSLAERVEQNGRNFIDLMNQKAVGLQLSNSQFSDPSGLNPNNISTVYDLAVLMNNCLMNPLIQKILETEKIDIFSIDKQTVHHLENTNKLLNGNGIIAGKTGYTEEAGECLIIVAKLSEGNKYFISVILGSEIGMRFIEAEKLVKFTKQVSGW